MYKCCEKCFDSKHIKDFIYKEGQPGLCNYCNRSSNFTISTNAIGNFFRKSIKRAYENIDEGTGAMWDGESKNHVNAIGVKTNGYSVWEILYEIEDIFSNSTNANLLVEHAFKDSGPSIKEQQQGEFDNFSDIYMTQLVLSNDLYGMENCCEYNEWDKFKYIIQYHNRFFDFNNQHFESRESLLKNIAEIFPQMELNLKSGMQFFRVRKLEKEVDFKNLDFFKEISPAPKQFAKKNRMSPEGIAYTYLADDIDTCCRECRLVEGDKALLGYYELKSDIKILDLTKNKHFIIDNSIFKENYNHDKNWIDYFIRFFVEEIGKPVKDEDSSIEYLPTQLIAEFIRVKGYKGIKFKSSVSTGKFSYVFFCGPNIQVSKEFYENENPDYPQLTEFTEWFTISKAKHIELKSDSIKVLEEVNRIIRKDLLEIDTTIRFYEFNEIKEALIRKQNELMKEYDHVDLFDFVYEVYNKNPQIEHKLDIYDCLECSVYMDDEHKVYKKDAVEASINKLFESIL